MTDQLPLFDELVEQPNESSIVPTSGAIVHMDEEADQPTTLGAFRGAGDVAFDSSDLVFPRIRLAQAMTAEVVEGTAKAGQYVLSGMEPLDAITVVPGMFTRRRMLVMQDTDVLCRSNDAVTGVGNPGGSCELCPFSHWTGSQETKDRKPPACTFMYSYIVFVAEWETIGILDFKKTSISAGKVVNTLAARFGLGQFGFQLRAVSQTNANKQKYYVMSAVPAKVAPEVLSTAKQFFTLPA